MPFHESTPFFFDLQRANGLEGIHDGLRTGKGFWRATTCLNKSIPGRAGSPSCQTNLTIGVGWEVIREVYHKIIVLCQFIFMAYTRLAVWRPALGVSLWCLEEALLRSVSRRIQSIAGSGSRSPRQPDLGLRALSHSPAP